MDSGWTVDEEPNFEDEREASKSEYATLRHAVEGPPSLPAYRNAPVKLEPAQSYAPSRPLMFGQTEHNRRFWQRRVDTRSQRCSHGWFGKPAIGKPKRNRRWF